MKLTGQHLLEYFCMVCCTVEFTLHAENYLILLSFIQSQI